MFSLHCNSIHPTASIVHLRAISSFLFHCCDCINTSVFSTQYLSSNLYSNVTTSTRINSSSVHTYICVCFIRNYIPVTFSNGLLTNNSTWCQNRGCICISSTRRTYGRIHIQFPAYIQSSRQVQ